MRKLYAFLFTLVFTLSAAIAQQTNGTGGGVWTDPNTWQGGTIPAANATVTLVAGDSLVVDTTVTVDDMIYEYENCAACVMRINSGETLTTLDDFRFEADDDDAKANLIIEGTLTVGSASGNDIRVIPTASFDNLSVTIDINSGGSLDIGDKLRVNTLSGSASNTFTLISNGTYSSGNIEADFADSDSRFIWTCNGDFDASLFDVDLNANTSDFIGTLNASADVDITSLLVFSEDLTSRISLTTVSGSDIRTTSSLFLRNNDDNSSATLDADGNVTAATLNVQSVGDGDTINVLLGANAVVSATNANFLTGGTGNSSLTKIDITSGASFTASFSNVIQNAQNATMDVDINGTYDGSSLTIRNLDNGSSTIDVAATGILTGSNIVFDYRTDGDLAFTNNGVFTSTGNIDFQSTEADDLNITLNNSLRATGRLYLTTTGNNSSANITLSDSIECAELRMDVNTTAATADNGISMTSSGAVLSVTSINMDVGVRDATIISAENGTTTTLFRGSTTTDLPIRSTVDYDNLIISNTSSGGVTLDEGNLDTTNFHGDLTITSSARFDLNSTNSVNVQGDLLNQGTYDDNGTDLNVDGNFTNSFVFNNAGSDYTIGGNLSNSGTFNTTSASTSMTVTGNFTNSSTFDAEITTLDVNGDFSNTGAYTSAGNNINLAGDWANSGTYTFATDDEVTMDGSALQELTGNTTFYDLTIDNSVGGTAVQITSGHDSIQNKLQIDDGTFSTGGNLTLLSNATGTGFLTDMTAGTGSISGNVTVERFLNKGNGWYLLGSPVSGADLEDWNTELPMSGFTGSDEATNPWVSVYNYDETSRPTTNSNTDGVSDSGYVEATNTNQVMAAGEGWFVYFQDVKAGAKDKTTDLTGPLNTGTVNVSVSYSELYFPAQAENGWNMIANPYASPVNWQAVTVPTQIQNSGIAYRLAANGNYQEVDRNGTDQISSGEGVWVQVGPITRFVNPSANNTNNYTVTFNENDKKVDGDSFNTRLPNPQLYQIEPLKLRLTYNGKADYYDESKIKVVDGATVHYDQNHDARKLGNAVGIYPNISSTTSSDTTDEKLMWNSIPNIDSVEIPIRVWQRFPSNATRTFNIKFDGIDEWVKNNRCLILEDRRNNKVETLNANNEDYSFTAMDTISDPFIYLTYMTPLEVSSENISCFGYNDGSASIEGFGTGSHNYTWIDAQGTVIMKEKDKFGPSTKDNLIPGEYTVWVSDNGQCGEVAATVIIEEPEPIIAEFSSDVDTVYMNSNTTIFFSNSSINADEYHWDFGDGNTSDAENPAHTYTSGGDYTVKLVAIDGDCSDTLSMTVSVIDNVGIEEALNSDEDITIYQQFNQTFVDLDFDENTDVTIEMFDVVGRSVISPVRLQNVKTQKVELDTPNDLFGVYTIRVIAGDQKVAKKFYYAQR